MANSIGIASGGFLYSDNIIVHAKFRFTALHNWPDAPDSHAYLRQLHRHEFHVTVGAKVHHDDRDIEFIDMKETISAFCKEQFEGKELVGVSCEMMAKAILNRFEVLTFAKVEEDGENGAAVVRTYTPESIASEVWL